MGAGVSAQEAEPPSPTQSPSGEASDQERQHPAAADRRPVQKNGQISGIHGNSEDQEVLNGKLEQLNGLQEEAIPGKVEPSSLSQEEELEEMELEQKETPTETKDEEPEDSHEAADTPAEIGEEAQAEEVGFKKVFKFVGCKITVKKEKPVKLEPVQLLTVKKGEDGEADGESKQEEEGTKNGEASPVAEAEGSPPEILSPLKTEESGGQAELKPAAAEEISVPVESAASTAESPAADSPLKRFFRQGFFSVLRRKPSFKKAKDESLVTAEKTEENGEQKENGDQVIAPGDVKGEGGDRGAKSQKEAPASEETAEILDVPAVEEKDDDFEDLTAELAKVRETREAPALDGGKGGVSAEQDQLQEAGLALAAAALEKDLVSQSTAKTEQSVSAEGEVSEEFVSLGAPEGLSAEHTDMVQEQSSVKASEPIMGEAELLSSQEKAKLQGSPLKKLFTSSSIKKLSSKRTKGKKGESKPGDAGDDARLQSSTESESSPEGQKPESPLMSPEEMGEAVPAETADAPDSVSPEAEGINGSANGEAKKESITAWASFKKLVTSKKRQSPKVPSESDKEDDQTDKAKSATISSNESAASVEKEEAKSITEEQSLEPGVEDPRKKADAPVSWEALICVGSSKKRARKLSDSEAPKPNEEAQRLTEESGQVQEDAEEVKVSSPPDTDQEHDGTSPEGVTSPAEEVSGAISTWESFKRLVTSRRKSKSKLEERADEPGASAETTAPEIEPAKEESWASFKKLIPGRRKKKSDTKPEPLAEGDEGDAKWAELGVSKSDEESDTPAVVPLSEYDAMEEERAAKEQRITIAMDKPLTKPEAPAGTGELSAEQTVATERGPLEVIKSSIDERSPSWISAAVSNVVDKTIDEENIVEETVAVDESLKEEAELGGAMPLAEAMNEIDAVEVAEEAQEMTSEVVTALEYPAEESLTEETTEMVSAVSQLTETPVTTAEGTPIREDEALMTRQTQEVLQEAAKRVKLSAVGPAVSSGETPAAPEAQGPEITPEKTQAEVVEAPCEIEMLPSAQEAKVPDVASEGTVSVESEGVRHGLSEMVQQTVVEMQEVSALQSFEPEPRASPPVELEATAKVAQMGECGILQEDKAAGLEGMLRQPTEEIPAEEVATARAVEAGILETVMEKVEAGEVQSLLAETLESSGAADVVKPEAPSEGSIEVTGTSYLGELLPESEETVRAETAEALGVEEVEAIPAKEAATAEAISEPTDGETQEVAPEVKAEKVEDASKETVRNAQGVGGEVEAEETVETGRVNVEVVCKQSTEIIPESVTRAVCSDEDLAITPAVTLTEVFSEEMASFRPAVEVTEAVLGKETVVVTPVVTVAEVVGEETASLTPAVAVSEAALGDEENVQIIPVVGVTEVLHSEETIKNTPVVQVTEIACVEKVIESSPIVVTEVVCSADATEVTPVVGVEAMESEGTVQIGPAVEVMEAVCTKDTSVMAEAGPPGESTEISPPAKVLDVSPVVEETEAVHKDAEMIPVVEETQAVCVPEGTEVSPVMEETEAVRVPEGAEISPVVKEMQAAQSTEISPVVKETEAVRDPEGTEVSPVVEEMVAVRSQEDAEVSPVVEETDVVRGPEGREVSPIKEEIEALQEGTEVSPVVEETQAVCGPEGTEVSPVVEKMVAVQGGIEVSAVVKETEDVPGPEGTEISPEMEEMDTVHSQEDTEVSPVTGETEAAQEGIEVIPIVGEMEAARGPEDTEVSSVVEEVITVRSQEGTEISAVVEETEAVQEGTEVSAVVEETEAVHGPEGTEVSPVVEKMEAVQEGIEISAVVEETEVVSGPESTEVSAVVEETEALQEGIEIGAVVEKTEALRGSEGTEVSPVMDETETIQEQEAIDTSPALEKIVCVDSREMAAVDLVKVAMREDEAVYEGKDDLTITQQQGMEKDAQMIAIDNDEITQEQFGTVKIIQEIVATKECGEAAAENIETQVSETVCKEIKTLEEMEDEQRTKEQEVEILIPATEMIHLEPSTVELSKETIQTSVTERTVIEVVKCVETEIDATICNKRLQVAVPDETKEEAQSELQQEASVVEVTCITMDVSQLVTKEQIGPAELPKDEFEILPGAPAEKTEVTEAPIAEEVESETKESLSIPCVTSEAQITVTEELTATHEGESIKQVVEPVREVECELPAVEKDKAAPREAESVETLHTDGEPALGDQLDGARKGDQGDVAGPKECEATEGAAESQKDATEDSGGATDERVIEVDAPGELASTHTSTERGKEEPELDEGLALGSDHKVKLHSDSDKLHAVESEPTTPIVGSSVALKEVFIPVTEAAIEEQVVTETAVSGVTEHSELSTGDEVSQAAQPDIGLGPVAETAAAIVEVVIEAAASTVVDTPGVSQETASTLDGQKQESALVEQLEGALAEQPSEPLEMEIEVNVSETMTFEQQSTMLVQGHTQHAVMPAEVQVDAVSAEQGKDSVQLHKEGDEKVPEQQTVTTAEGKSDEVIGQSTQTQKVGETEALEQEVAHSTELVSEAAGEGDQKSETEIGASVEAGRERELPRAPISEEAEVMPDVSKITKVECCQSVEKPEEQVSLQDVPGLTETKEQSVEQASLQDVPTAMTLPAEESRTLGAADETLEGDAVESIEHTHVQETDQSKMAEAVEKQGDQPMSIEHQMDQSSTLECAKNTAEQTPS